MRRHGGNNRNRKRHSSKLRSTFETCGNRHASAYPARVNSTPEITHQRPRLPRRWRPPITSLVELLSFRRGQGATRKSESTVARPSRPIHARPRRFLQAGEKLCVRRPVVNCIPGQESAFRHVGACVCRNSMGGRSCDPGRLYAAISRASYKPADLQPTGFSSTQSVGRNQNSAGK